MIKYISIVRLILAPIIRQWIVLVFLGYASVISAQGVLSGAQTGTIEDMNPGDRSIIISGRSYKYSGDVTEVIYDGEEQRTQFLNEGLVVRFVVNRDGILARIEVLGPVNLIQALEEN